MPQEKKEEKKEENKEANKEEKHEEKHEEKKVKKKKVKKVFKSGIAHIKSTFNNTVISITDTEGNVVAWASSGSSGFNASSITRRLNSIQLKSLLKKFFGSLYFFRISLPVILISSSFNQI